MAAADVLHVSVRGTGGHASTPHHAKDPIAVAAELVGALQTLVTRQFDVFDPVVVTVRSFHAGTQHNIIPHHADFDATVRSFSSESHGRIRDSAVGLRQGIAAAYGLHAQVEWQQIYPVTTNNESYADFYAGVARELFGEQRAVTMRSPDGRVGKFLPSPGDRARCHGVFGCLPSGCGPGGGAVQPLGLRLFSAEQYSATERRSTRS